MKQEQYRNSVFILIVFILSVILINLPTGFEKNIDKNAIRCRAKVIDADDSGIFNAGLIKTGDQLLRLKILNTRFKGREVSAGNSLLGQLDRDEVFKVGDEVFATITVDDSDNVIFVNVKEHYRIGLELLLFAIFGIFLFVFAGSTGARSLLSFVFSGLCIWKLLVPFLLKGVNPVYLSLFISGFLSFVIIFLVAGLNKKGLVAFTGAFSGVIVSCIMAVLFTGKLHIHGAIMPFSEQLLYSGFSHLNLTSIYISGVFIACSGAVMDIAMDISASMHELYEKNRDISFKELLRSGMDIGRAVTGTMTTTLLLAYSGGYITLLMVFMAQGTHAENSFNLIYVAAEILKTITGSFGIVVVAPLTAFAGAFVFRLNHESVTARFNMGELEFDE